MNRKQIRANTILLAEATTMYERQMKSNLKDSQVIDIALAHSLGRTVKAHTEKGKIRLTIT